MISIELDESDISDQIPWGHIKGHIAQNSFAWHIAALLSHELCIATMDLLARPICLTVAEMLN